jgi:hypothetical protein
MPIYVLRVLAANHWGRPSKIELVGPFPNETRDLYDPGIKKGSKDNKIAEVNARRWMAASEQGVLRSTVVELDEPVVVVKEPWVLW